MQRLIAVSLFLLTLPLYPVLFVIIKLTSPGPFIFKQQRMGKNKKIFTIYKFRTMVEDAERQKLKYQNINEADGPVFKIKNDPRYTSVGKLLNKTALDEFPQLINVIKGDMALVGPRPLPISEAEKVPEKYNVRFSILPGLTSSWVINGSHKLSFKEWMMLDVNYANNKNLWWDLEIIVKTILLILNSILRIQP